MIDSREDSYIEIHILRVLFRVNLYLKILSILLSEYI
jgi:hypothetical protein